MTLSKATFIFFIFCCLNASAQIQNFRFERIGLDEGLSHSYIYDIFQDSKGFIWIATIDGANRYDGYKIQNFHPDPENENSINSRNIRQIIEDGEGNIWFRSKGYKGISRFNPLLEEFTNFFPDDSVSNHLSNQTITQLFLDKNKTLWLGTFNGLKKFRPASNDFERFLENDSIQIKITEIIEDENGFIWVGSDKGLFRINTNTGEELWIRSDSDRPTSLNEDQIGNLFSDSDGNLWVITTRGINILSSKNKYKSNPDEIIFNHYLESPNFFKSGEENIPILQDSKRNIWVGVTNGLFRFEKLSEENNYKVKSYFQKEVGLFGETPITHLLEDSKGRIWVGSSENSLNFGLRLYDEEKDNFVAFNRDDTDPNSLSNDKIRCMMEDDSGVLWIGTSKGALNKIDLNQKQFFHFKKSPENDNTLLSDVVYSVFEDSQSNVYFGTEKGLTIYYPKTGIFESYDINSPGKKKLQGLKIGCFEEDDEGFIWMGFYDNQFAKFNPKTKEFTDYLFNEEAEDPIYGWSYRDIYMDGKGSIWLASSSHSLIEQYQRGKFRYFIDSADFQGPSKLIWKVYQAPLEKNEDVLWIGTQENGLKKFSIFSKSFISYKENESNSGNIPSNCVKGILQTEKGRLWLATENGFCDFNMTSGKFKTYTTSNGLPSNNTHSLLQDNSGNIWISTSNGLSKFNPVTETFKNFDKSDGLQSNEFHEVARYKNKNGGMYFGGVNGVNFFYPDSIHENPILPQVEITDLLIFNQEINIGDTLNGKVMLDQSISYTKNMGLSYLENDLTFLFSAMHYANPKKNQYKYKLEGYDKEWKQTDGLNRMATYTNLDPGDYIFNVKASNNDGKWNDEPATIKISISPPWWETIAFKVMVVLISISIIYGIYEWRTRYLLLLKKRLQKLVKEQNKEILVQNEELQTNQEELSAQNQELQATLERLKETQSQLIQSEKMASIGVLTAGIAHEINNPVNFIKNGVVGIKKSLKHITHLFSEYGKLDIKNDKIKEIEDYKQKIQFDQVLQLLIKTSENLENGVERTTGIIKGLRTFSRVDEKKLAYFDLNENIDTTLQILAHQFKNKIAIKKKFSKIPLLYGYQGKMNQVFMNIMVNAFHAMENGGCITISTFKEMNNIFISIKDTGKGMSNEAIKKAFDPFFTTKEVGKGTGLGLYISLGIIKEHNGRIEVNSQVGKGSEFLIILPTNNNEGIG